MAKKSTEIDDIEETYEGEELDNIDLNMDEADRIKLSRRRIEELREEKELHYSMWGDMDLP